MPVLRDPTPFIGIDWGSTNARAFLFDDRRKVIDSRRSSQGVKNIQPGAYREAFEAMTAAWRQQVGDVPVLLSGMVGSRTGWHEVPYLSAPVKLSALSRSLFPVPEVPQAFIVPGLRTSGARPDVMRGEELQLLGLGAAGADCDLVCIPGTHAKWVETDGNEVRDFHTAMTGEVFAAVLGHTLFASLAAPPASGSALRADSFSTGIARSAPPHGLLHAFFELRAGILLEQLEPTELADLISGLLIGTEIRHMASSCRPRARIALLGATGLAERYAHALRVLEFIPVIFDVEEVTTRGFAELARLCAEDGACSGGL